MPASGKTTLGYDLSKRLAMQFVDTDQLFEDKTSMKISQFWEKNGELRFRILERKIMFECLSNQPSVIATGGGLPVFMDNMYFLNHHKTIYLKADLKILQSRIITTDRPILNVYNLNDLFNQRRDCYESAKFHYVLQDSIDSLLNNLIK